MVGLKNQRIFAVCCVVQLGLIGDIAFAKTENDLGTERYFAARIAEFDNRDEIAFYNFQALFKTDRTSPAIASRLYQSAILLGDIETAILAARTLELEQELDATMPLLLFADAYKRRDWKNARISIADLEAKGNFGFISPVLSAWVNIGQGKAHEFDFKSINDNPLLNYYAGDQSVYLELASGNIPIAKSYLKNFRNLDNGLARDLIINSSPILAANDEKEFVRNMLEGVVEPELIDNISGKQMKRDTRLPPYVGIASIFTRFSAALIDQNSPQQALTMARIATWVDGKSEPAKLALSKSLYAMDRRELGFSLLSKIPPSSPYRSQAIAEKIQRLTDEMRRQEALILAKEDVQLNPASSRSLMSLAQTYEHMGNYANAAATYQKLLIYNDAVNGSPRTKAYYLLSMATSIHKGGNWTKARIILEEANTLDPNNAYILNYLGFTLLERREDIQAALGLVKQAYQIAPNSVAMMDSLGWGYYLTGEYGKAVQILESAVKQVGADVIINEHLGDAYWIYGKRVDARYAWKAAAYKATDAEKQRLQNKIDLGMSQHEPLGIIAN
jgi:tetratricopeptide (TPR) repeat protein